MRATLISVLSLTIFYSQSLFAQAIPRVGFSQQEVESMAKANQFTSQMAAHSPWIFSQTENSNATLIEKTDVRSFAEYEDTGYLIFSSNFFFDSKKAKQTMVKNLPEGVQLVVFTGDKQPEAVEKIKKDYEGLIDLDRLTIVYMPGSDHGFWARDGVPVPVIRTTKKRAAQEIFTVVDAKYSRFEQDKRFSELFHSELTRYDYYFEGGNFMTNSINQCLVVNTRPTAEIPDYIFEQHYGCKTLVRLPFVKGIGHADESVKFIDDNTVLTDEKSYVPVLKEHGFKVIELPRPRRNFETYVNSLLINGTIFVPIFGQSGDSKALDVYRSLGLNVIGINSKRLSNEGMGSLHCITMTYPPIEMSQLLLSMGGVILP